MTVAGSPKPKLLLFVAPVDHRHRDAACATLAWIAAEEGKELECYYGGLASGAHYGGGSPGAANPVDLRGGTFTGGHHIEELYLLVQRFDCEAACLGETILDGALAECEVPVRARSGDIASFYKEVLAGSVVPRPAEVLVVGDGGSPQGVPLGAYAFPEIFRRRVLAVAAGDPDAVSRLGDVRVDEIWTSPQSDSVSVITRAMAERRRDDRNGWLFGDPELIGRWTPTAIREGWLPVFGVPQHQLIKDMRKELSTQDVVFGRQQDDRDFLELSRAGTGFQLIDPGRPAFPALKSRGCTVMPGAAPSTPSEPDEAMLRRWAAEGRVLTSLLFWTGMVRELENLYALADVLALSGAAAGWVLTTESFEYMPRPPLTLAGIPRERGGLAPRVELLLASGGAGAFLESEVHPQRFREVLRRSVDRLARLLGGPESLPTGWWSVMDAPLEPRLPPRLTRQPELPFVRIRYRGRSGSGEPAGGTGRTGRPSLRRLVRNSPVRALFEPHRPFDGYQPGPPGKAVLEAVRDAGFRYAFTKSAFARPPAVVTGVPGLTAINYTVGRWDGWTPFATVNSLGDLKQAERRLLRSRKPGWLVGTLDTCLWAFTGPVWHRAGELRAICEWLARGGTSGRLINTTPGAVARYAELLRTSGRVGELPAR